MNMAAKGIRKHLRVAQNCHTIEKRDMSEKRRDDADWKGKHEKLFNWRRLRWEWGRMCYRTDFLGDTLEAWWEPDEQHSTETRET